jgi:hypothetical protein
MGIEPTPNLNPQGRSPESGGIKGKLDPIEALNTDFRMRKSEMLKRHAKEAAELDEKQKVMMSTLLGSVRKG